MEDLSDLMWRDVFSRVQKEGRSMEWPVRFRADVEGLAPATLVEDAGSPRVLLSPAARERFEAIDPLQIAALLEDAAERLTWSRSFSELRSSPRSLSLNEACRLCFGPAFRQSRHTQRYNAYVELQVAPELAASVLPKLRNRADSWPTLADLRDAWLAEQPNRAVGADTAVADDTRAGLSPARKRLGLATLRADRLRDLTRHFDLVVRDLRDREALVSALADGRRLEYRAVLENLTREELKDICAELGIDAVARDKSTLASRILADDPPRNENSKRSRPSETGSTLSAKEKRIALDVLKLDRLKELARELEVEVSDQRSRELVVAALSDGRRLDFSVLLSALTRDELTWICEALDTPGGRGGDKAALISRISGAGEQVDEDDEPADAGATTRSSAPELLTRLCSESLRLENQGRGWPARGVVNLATGAAPVDVYIRSISRSGRNRPMERRFQNPADKGSRVIRAPESGYALLLGAWDEQGENRAVLVAMDAYRRLGADTRFSLFVPLAVLEEAADTGWAEHRSGSGELIYAFRPSNLSTYVDRLIVEAGLRPVTSAAPPPTKAPTISIAPQAVAAEPAVDANGIHIRPKVGMYAAFARLNYKPWFAIAEFVDNAIQSYLAGPLSKAAEPLLIDIRIDDDEIVITDRAGGIAQRDFPRAFSPSQPPPDATGLSEFGLGMKAAACWFAREWSVRTKALGEGVERTISFDVPRITRESIETLPFVEKPCDPGSHYTVITLTNLLVRPKGRTLAKIRDHLTGIYRVLLRSGRIRIRLSTGHSSELLDYEEPKLLVAPHFREPDGEPREWRKEIDFALAPGRRVHGWAGLLEIGSVSRAGFSVFRRGRLIQGSGDETYRPPEIFRSPNSYTYQRVVGELHVEGFDVSHTKDGIQWDGLEEAVVARLKLDLSSYQLPLLSQAEGYRARRRAKDLEAGFGLSAVVSAGAVLSSDTTADVLVKQIEVDPNDQEQEARAPRAAQQTLTKRTFNVNVRSGQLPWAVTIELTSDPAAEWFTRGSETKIEERSIHVCVNLSHPFSEQFLNDSETVLAPVLRIVCGLALAEETARESGVKNANAIRRNLNQLLREALGGLGREDT